MRLKGQFFNSSGWIFDQSGPFTAHKAGAKLTQPPYLKPMTDRKKTPRRLALIVLIGAITLAMVTLFKPDTPPPATTDGWVLEDGKIEITTYQYGKPVTGHFGEFQAEITYDDDKQIIADKEGTVKVTVSIQSLSLGVSTKQALGPDFFDVTQYPQASFTADLMNVIDGREAIGTLTIKGRSQPVALPFQLVGDDTTATAHANLTLDRRDFGIGDNLKDDTVLGFEVKVKITLTAKNQATP